MLRKVAVIALPGVAVFELGVMCELFGSDRTKISPYSPSSRLFLETLHIDPTAVSGFAGHCETTASISRRSDP